jgi:hypothetical protein
VVYSLSPHKVTSFGEVDTKTLSESDILLDLNVRRKAWVDHPGLCAEEYQRMMELVIRHLLTGISKHKEVMEWVCSRQYWPGI